ncbi:MAG: hypothetical protein LAO21_09585 [Acidobacteriia bacterium]|nr:hypothetical protein [Terriglobia bacterium]
MRLLKVFACLALLTSTMLWAQSKDDIQERLKANEERIKALESEIKDLKAILAAVARNVPTAPVLQGVEPQAPPPAQLPPTPQTIPTTPTLSGESAGQIPVYGGSSAAAKALNPDISVIGDFLGSIGRNPLNPVPTLEMHESEVGFQAIVDPYARADFFLSFGEEGVNLEEGFLTFTSLPAGLVVRAGKMRAAFGKVNTLHNHVLPWTDRPLVTGSLVGGEDGINDAGLSVTRILPAPRDILLEGTLQVFRGDSADVFKSSRNRDVSLVGHLRGYRDLTESTNLDLGLSYARGHNELGSGFLTQLYGMDATVHWKPLRRAIYHSFVGRTELIWSQRQQTGNVQRAFGLYTSGDYQLARRWFIGGRYDRSARSNNANLIDSGFSTILTYWPSEFSQIRGQYRFAHYAEGRDGNELRFQLQFSLGAHGAHPF